MKKQDGASTLVVVLMLFLLGVLVLAGQTQQYELRFRRIHQERAALEQWNMAFTLLAWGTQQQWSPATDWLCQVPANGAGRACMRQISQARVLLAASPETPAEEHNEKTHLILWRWGTPTDTGITWLPQGWIDFCPLSENKACILP
jgi:hypothetical protein